MNRKVRRGHKSQSDGGGSAASSEQYIQLFGQAVHLQENGNDAGAEKIYQQILLMNPDHAHSLNMLGHIAMRSKKYDVAEQLIRRAMTKEKDVPTFYLSLGDVLKAQNKTDEALKAYQYALELKPGSANVLEKLGHIYRDLGRYPEAIDCFKQVATVRPMMYGNVAMLYSYVGNYPLAIAQYKKLLEAYPDSFEALNNLAIIYSESYTRFEEAIVLYKKALTLQPERSEVINNLASVLKQIGQLDEAIVYFKKAIALNPNDPALHSNLIMTMIYASSVTPEDIANEARYYGEHFAKPLLRQKPFKNSKDPDRKLRVGFVSPDFRKHPVHSFFEPLAEFIDHEKIEIYAYSHTVIESDITERIKKKVDHWRDIRYINDDDAAALIRSDMIDILIDLTGHTGDNRLLIFARKPAPIQVTWLGYPATTGIKAIDYRFTDIYAEPPGMTEYLNVETLWRLPEIFCCYQGDARNPAVIDHPPFEDNGYITFGCFNAFTKVTDPVLETWERILSELPDSKLLLEIGGIENPDARAKIETHLKKFLPMEQVLLEPRKNENQYFLYNKLDIALDPFPCVGGTTSFDAMWMGTPFVTLAGRHFTSRMGVTILTNAGLPELIAQNTDEYVKIAVDLARDRERLKKIRHNLRDKVLVSPLMDQKRFARNMEDAFREMWRKYLAK